MASGSIHRARERCRQSRADRSAWRHAHRRERAFCGVYNRPLMCGIYGMVAEGGAALRYPEVLEWMGDALRHRGPDGHAVLTHPHAVIGTERLRIIDLHERADQPFVAPGAQVWLECNGEIYNAA